MNARRLSVLLGSIYRPVQKTLHDHATSSWHVLLLGGDTLLLMTIWLFHGMWLTNWRYDGWLAGLCITCIGMLVCAQLGASLHGHHPYQDLWVRGALWIMVLICLSTTILFIIHVS